LLFFSFGEAFAEELSFKFDRAKTQVEFTLGDILHTVHGAFQLKSGFINFDDATGAAQGSVVVDATSGNSGSEGRDQRMHTQILESQRYPEITFVPKHVAGQIAAVGESQLTIEGILTLHGTPHLVSIVARVNPAADTLTADTQFDVPYVKWGLKNPSTFILRVSSTVNIHIRAGGRLQTAPNHP
jgi:polyisoprenoid-binding protein YceI